MNKPTDDQVRWMVHHPIQTVIFFLLELPFFILFKLMDFMLWLIVKTETKESRRMRRAIMYYILKSMRS